MINSCVSVELGVLWTNLKQSLLDVILIFMFVGGVVGVFGWRRPTHMAWLHNKLILSLIGLIAGPVSIALILADLSHTIHVEESCIEAGRWWLRLFDSHSGWNVWVIGFPIVGGLMGAVYFFKAARPAFLVTKTGNRAVDEAVARYRKEREAAFIGRPRLVVDGTGHYQVLYMPEGAGEEPWQEADFLVLREDGQAVTDEALAVQVMRVANAAFELGEPGKMEYRWWMYKEALPRLAQALREVERSLRQMLKGAQHLGKYEAIREDLRRLQRVLLVMSPFVELQRQDLEVLARWSWQKKGPKMRELSEGEVEAIEKELKALRYWMEDEGRIRAMEEGEEAWARLRAWLQGPGGRRLAEEEPWTYEFLEELVGIWEDEEGFGIPREAWEKARRGELRWFKPGDEEDIASWRRRLAWVRAVDGRQRRRGGAVPQVKPQRGPA